MYFVLYIVYRGYILNEQKSKDPETYSSYFFLKSFFSSLIPTINFPITDFY